MTGALDMLQEFLNSNNVCSFMVLSLDKSTRVG